MRLCNRKIKRYNKVGGNNEKIRNQIHTRLESAKRLDMEEVPVIYADDLTEKQIKAFRLVDNKVSEKSMWDYTKLDEELDSILDIDMSMFDFNINTDDVEIERIDLSNKEFEKYEIIITCQNEIELEEKYNKLMKEGYECKISTY